MGPRTVVDYRTSKAVQFALGGLTFIVVVLAVGLALIVSLVFSLKAERDQQAAREQAQINSALCQVVTQFPPGLNPTLDHVRDQLHCPPPTTIAQP
jgi:sensor domain CHASE-containing protein